MRCCTVDLHTHILPERWEDLDRKYGYGGFVRLEHHRPCHARMMVGDKVFREIDERCWSPGRRVLDLDRLGVDLQVLSTVPVMFSYWAKAADALDLSRFLNDHLAGVIAAGGGRFAGLGTVPLQDPEMAARELERCVRELRLPGVQIGTNVNGVNLGDPSLRVFFQAAARLDAAIFVHPWEMLGRDRMGSYWLPWLVGMPAETALAVSSVVFSGMLQELPGLRLCFAHGGGSFPFTLGRIQKGFRERPDLCQVHTQVSPRDQARRLYFDSLVHSEEALRFLLELAGPERLALGSDYPFPLGEHEPGQLLRTMGLPPAALSRVLGGTALEFLRMDPAAVAPAAAAPAITVTDAPARRGPFDLSASDFRPTLEFAEAMDRADPFARFRERFECPQHEGRRAAYFTGNSLGLMPRRVRELLSQELDEWSTRGVEAHVEAARPWVSYHEQFRETGARLVGARPGEVVMMNSLTVNLHLMMVSFYRPAGERTLLMVEEGAFPSDTYAVRSHVASRGLDPARDVVMLKPTGAGGLFRTEDVIAEIRRLGRRLALVMLGGVNYFTGQKLDMAAITEAARSVGACCGWDLAHAVGNVPLRLHEWGPDFACWCSYKYLNSGPGAVAGVFVHERHARDPQLARYSGWWSNDPATRFAMKPELALQGGAEGWQISNPPIFSLTPLLASLEVFEEADGVEALRGKSRVLTAWLEYLLRELGPAGVEVITPADPESRGCQLSLRVRGSGGSGGSGRAVDARELCRTLAANGVVLDYRQPDVLRAAPVPLYNSFEDVWRLVGALRGCGGR